MPKYDRADKIIKKVWECKSIDPETWFRIEKEVAEEIKTFSEEELTYLRNSGYCESLHMICEGFRYEMKKR